MIEDSHQNPAPRVGTVSAGGSYPLSSEAGGVLLTRNGPGAVA